MFMAPRRILASAAAFVLAAAAALSNAMDKKSAKTEEQQAGWNDSQMQQPATESLDLNACNAIREEGLQHSHVMDYAGGLADGIGPRLTGSPNMAKANAWTRDQFTKMGCANAHLEDWGEFGMGWQQVNTWVRMSSPDTAVFIAQAAPWSPSSNGAINAEAVSMEVKKVEDLEKYKGKVAGKIVLYGEMREVKPVDKALFERYDDKDLAKLVDHPVAPERDYEEYMKTYAERTELRKKTKAFLVSEHALAMILPSRDGRDGGGSGGTIFDDGSLGGVSYQRDHAIPFPVVVMAIESYGRVHRLLKAHVPVNIEMNVDTKFFGDHEHGFDTIAEIPGTDPKLKDELV